MSFEADLKFTQLLGESKPRNLNVADDEWNSILADIMANTYNANKMQRDKKRIITNK